MNRRIKTITTVWLAALLLAAQSLFTFTRVTRADDTNETLAQGVSEMSQLKPQAVPGRLLVKYRDGVSSTRRNSMMMAAGARSERELPGLGVQVMELPDGADEEAYAQALKGQPEVEFAEPDYIVFPVSEMVPNDPMYSSQWHLSATSCPAAWGMTSGSDQITIAVCDTGVDSSHPDLAPKLVPGWNVVDNNSDTSPVSAHGTWTAGTAAAAGNNSIGIASPALNCRIMPVRVSSVPSGAALLSNLAAGVVWAADHGARVASVSYMGAASSTMWQAGSYIQSKGGVLVIAAGNTGTYSSAPDNSSVVVVSATNQNDVLAGFTTTGAYVDLAAPGVGILTTAPGNTYQAVNGTSFSTPLVAGAVGLMLSVNPSLSSTQIDTILKVSGDDLGASGWDPGYGWGRLNVGRAIHTAQGMLEGAPDTTSPALGFAQPQIGGVQSGLIGISGGELVRVNALDDAGVAQVSLYSDGVLVANTASAPYTFFCNTSSFADGSQHTLTATAVDLGGNSTSISTVVTARAGFDATPPTLGFVQPQAINGSASVGKSSSEPVQLDAQDNAAVASVSLFVDGALLGTISSAPYTFSWNTTSLAVGSQHTLAAVVADQAGNSTSASITVTVAGETTPPQVWFISPVNGERVHGNQTVSIAATDNVGVTRVEFRADNELVASWSAGPYRARWAANRLRRGPHTLTCTAYDAAGNTASSSITVIK